MTLLTAGTTVRFVPLEGPNHEQLTEGGACPDKNCVACVGATIAHRASCGRWDISGPQIRSAAGVSCWIGNGGLSYEKMAYGVRALTRGEVVITTYYRRTRTQVRDAVAQGAPLALSGLYSLLLGTRYACENNFRGGHGFAVNAYRVYSGQPQFRVGDPLADGRRDYRKGWVWMPADLVYRMGEARARSFGSYGITIAVANDTENVVRKARAAASLRSAPSLTAPKLRNVEKGRSYYCLGTVKGGAYTRDTDGGTSYGWWKAKHQDGTVGYVLGEILVPTWVTV